MSKELIVSDLLIYLVQSPWFIVKQLTIWQLTFTYCTIKISKRTPNAKKKKDEKRKNKQMGLSFTGSAKRLKRKGWTSSRVSGPPRLSSKTPILSSPIICVPVTTWFSEATTAFNGNKHFCRNCFENNNDDCDKVYLPAK